MTQARDTTADPARRQLFEASIIFAGNVLLCLAFLTPEIQGLGDAMRGWDQFNALFAGGEPLFGPDNQLLLRVMMVAATVCILTVLVLLGLIERRVLITYLALPASAYLATKIRMEFIFFPLALISTRLHWRTEALVILALLGLSLGLDENNGLILVFFRLGVLVMRHLRPPLFVIFLAVALIVLLDANIELLFPIFPELSVYSWTRDVVNPEFSHFETLIVLTSSMVLSAQPPIDFMFGLTYTGIMLYATFGGQLFTLRFYLQTLRNPDFSAGFLTVMFFTSVTHAFQSSRYYFFYVPMIASQNSLRANQLLILASWPMTFILVLYYRFYLGM